MADPPEDSDPQDTAETLDEDTLGIEDDRRRTFEELPDTPDFTSAVGDDDDEAGLIAEDLTDEEIIELEADNAEADPEDDELPPPAEPSER